MATVSDTAFRPSLRVPAVLLLVGQVLYILITQFHPGIGETATNHADVFGEYAASGTWIAVHVGQFLAMGILLAGLFGLFFAVTVKTEAARWATRLGAASAVAALVLYGAVQAVDGVANKHADVAWVNAADAEQAARFASAEAIRWIEWGMRSYHDFALGLALLLFGAALVRAVRVPPAIGYLMALSGLVYFAQAWVVGSEGFSGTESTTIVLAWVVSAVWMVWLLVAAWRIEDSPVSDPERQMPGR